MLTVLIESGDDPAALGATLASLIPGAIEGLVREVVVVDDVADSATRKVADHAGCRIVGRGGLAAAVTSARGDWLLLIESGARLSSGWIEAVGSHLADVGERNLTPRAARFTRSRADDRGVFGRIFARRTALAEGLLLPKAQAIGVAKRSATVEDMGKGLATLRLEATIRPHNPAKKR